MRFFHLSDLHIGLRLLGRDMGPDQRYILEQIIALARARQPEAVVVAGDIYDKAVPSAEAVSLFDWFLGQLDQAIPQGAVLVISGNHDSGPRINCFRSLLARQNLYLVGLPPQGPEEYIQQVTLEDGYGPVTFYLLPFVRPSMVRWLLGEGEEGPLSYEETVRRLLGREEICPQDRNVLVSHQFYLPAGTAPDSVERSEGEVRTVGNIDQVSAALLAPFDYAALGHLHKPMQAGSPVLRYCGSPLATSVSEAGQEKGVLEVTLGPKGQVETDLLPLTPLHPVRVEEGTLEEVLARPSEDLVSVLLTAAPAGPLSDSQEQLKRAFPNLLEIRVQGSEALNYAGAAQRRQEADPLSLCLALLGETGPEEEDILRAVIQSIEEGC